ncbi:MAG: hypothetical protein ACFFKA_00650 [Candidatus Thorarchaeota archaeon]
MNKTNTSLYRVVNEKNEPTIMVAFRSIDEESRVKQSMYSVVGRFARGFFRAQVLKNDEWVNTDITLNL